MKTVLWRGNVLLNFCLCENNLTRFLVKFKFVQRTFANCNSLSCTICTGSVNLPFYPCIMCMYHHSVMVFRISIKLQYLRVITDQFSIFNQENAAAICVDLNVCK